jgi:hypothetical protein
LCEPSGTSPIPVGTLAYFAERLRNHVYEIVIDEFEKSKISKVDLAKRLRKNPSQLTRWLGSPGNWELDSISEVLFSICGGEPRLSVGHPLRKAKRNFRQPDWLVQLTPEDLRKSSSGTVTASMSVS